MKAIASVQRTNEILNKYGLRAKKGYGQNFIIDSNIVENIALKSECEDACVIEIGPGIGALTQMLCIHAKHVVAYEIDTKLLEVLSDTLSEYDNVEIINEDFLNVDLDSVVASLKKKYGRVVVCANLPYYITTPILFKIFEANNQVDCITVMMQKEVADRFSASVISQYLYDIKTIIKISRNIFNPKPNVDSAVVQFKIHDRVDISDVNAFFELVKACFKQRRKTIYNNLREYVNDSEVALRILDKSGIGTNTRAQQLSLDDFINLYGVFEDERKGIC